MASTLAPPVIFIMYFFFYMAWISVGSLGNTITSLTKGPGFESQLNQVAFASSLLLGLDFHNPKTIWREPVLLKNKALCLHLDSVD